MQQTAESVPSTSSQTFAGLLAALASPQQKRQPTWSDDELPEDVATLSYEHALNTHARYRSAESKDLPAAQATEATRSREAVEAEVMAARKAAIAKLNEARSEELFAEPAKEPPARAFYDEPKAPERNLKCASITLRLSQAECEQLKKRAAEADLSVSAYLRSCAFEVETLRGQVKDTLAQMRATEALRAAESKRKPPASAPAPSKRSWLHWPMKA
jgi:hypothetical protein